MKIKRFSKAFLTVFAATTLLAASLTSFTGCKKAGASAGTDGTASSTGSEKQESKKSASSGYKANMVLETGEDNLVSYNSLMAFMKPDYTSQAPEKALAEKADKKEKGASKEKSDSVVPGLRALSEYKTPYKTNRQKITVKNNDSTLEEAENPKIPFTVTDWGPQGRVIADSENASFYVVFSQPVRSLAALTDPTDKSDIMTITPALKGVFRWYGTKHLAFEAEEAADPATEYTITISKDTKSLGGTPLKGQTTFKTKADQVSIKRIQGGYNSKGEYEYSGITGALPPYDKRIYLGLNYMITPARLNELLSIKIGNQKATFTAEPLYKPEMYSWGYPYYEVRCDEAAQKTDSYIITITSPIPYNNSVIVSLKGGDKEHSYKTLQPFKISSVADYTDYSEGQKTNPLRISFTQSPDEKTIIDNIKFDFDYKLTKDNIEIYDNTLTLYNLPISFNEEHKITFADGIKDVYGQSIQLSGRSSYNFTVRNAVAYIRFLDYGAKMLEAQFPHKILFEYQNLNPESFYTVASTANPYDLSSSFWKNDEYIVPSGAEVISTTKKNTRMFQEIDFEPFLHDGYGFVKFDAFYSRDYYSYWDDEWETERNTYTTTVQVTDLGITARLGLNKAVLMVRSLSSGKAVADADVYLFYPTENFSMVEDLITSSKTDSNGMCVITLTEAQIRNLEQRSANLYNDKMMVMVKNGSDKALFVPNSHYSWNFDISTERKWRVRKPVQRTFMFVDRGLYKPGETVTFRGIDRDQLLGTIKAHTSPYSIEVTENTWPKPAPIYTKSGVTSTSGGFYDSFKLPDDAAPGHYYIRFTRCDQTGNEYGETCYFTVAEFERLKIEASVKASDMTFHGGDKVSAELSADYLAGGALNGANYEASWYKQGRNFTTENPETKDYQYGPYNQYSWRTYYSDEKGKLSSRGTAQLSCNSEKITDGLTYDYRVEANVTDVSNQTIMASSNVTVHPSTFYVGLKKARNVSGFAKKDQALEFPYILVNTEGEKLGASEAGRKAASLEYVLKHDEWTMVHEQSISNSVYARYEKTEVEDEKGTVQITDSGLLTLTPKNTGWYTLEITGKDKKGNNVISSIGFYVTGSGMAWHGSSDSEELTLTPDQSLYNPGDKAQILLESPLQKGDYLITVEREGIFTEEIRHFDEPANVLEIPIANNYVPVVYLAVSSYSDRNGPPVHQYGETDLDKPKGYFGLCRLNINPEVRAFSIDVSCDKQTYLPGEEATITLTATKGGKPLADAELTLMAVDRGVLDLINYHVPNPIDFFYSQYNFPLYVNGGDSRALLMDPVTYSIKNLLGGDASADSDEEKDENERRDFRPTALFEPVLLTDKDGKASVTFKMPDSLTTYRITAFGVKDDLFSLKEDEVKVQNLINVQQVQPRRLRERDTAECGVLITNLDKKGQKVTVSIEARSPTRDTAEDKLAGRKTVPGKAFVDGAKEHTVFVASGDSTIVYFDVGAEQEGTVELVYTITSDLLNEKLASPIKIEKTFVYETVTMTGSTGDDMNEKITEGIIIPGFAKEGRGDLSFTLDATRLGVLGSSVRYLFDYPYGCFEQQSSRVLPLVLFGDYIDVFGLDSKVADINKCIMYYTNYWGKYQLQNGGFPYWETNSYSSFYVSLRIAHICAAIMERGIADKSDLGIDLSALTAYILDNLQKVDDYNKAYACYVLKLLGDNQVNSTLDSLYRRVDSLTHSAAAFVSLAYSADSGLSSVSKSTEINKKIRAYLQPAQRSVTVVDANRDDNLWWWFESKSEQLALILQAFVNVNPNDEMVDRLLFTLLQNQSGGYWTNTATTARVLDAIHAYIKMRNLDDTDFTADVNLGGKQIMKESFTGVAAKPKTLKLPFENELISSLEKDTPNAVTFNKDGNGRLYYTIEMKYALPDEMQSARNEGISLDYQITDYETGEVVNTSGKDNSVLTLESGKMYKATIRLESHRDRTYIALRAPIPSGAEILDSTFVTTSSAGEVTSSSESWGHWLSNKTIYDNEIQFFWDNFRVGSSTVTFTFRAVRRGVYPTPPVQAECMYEPEIFGRSDGYLVEIK